MNDSGKHKDEPFLANLLESSEARSKRDRQFAELAADGKKNVKKAVAIAAERLKRTVRVENEIGENLLADVVLFDKYLTLEYTVDDLSKLISKARTDFHAYLSHPG